MGARTCTAAGKVAFVRHQDAEKLIARYAKRNRGLAAAPLSPYRCTTCRRWHVTNMTPAESAEYQAARGKPAGAPKAKPKLRGARLRKLHCPAHSGVQRMAQPRRGTDCR